LSIYRGGRVDDKTRIKFKHNTRVTRNLGTKLPKTVVDIDTFPTELKEGTIPLTEKNVEGVFKRFLAEHRDFFGVNTEDLKIVSQKKIRGKWYVKYQQYYKDVPVYRTSIGVASTEQGKVLSYDADYHDKIAVETTPKVSLEQAVQTAKSTMTKALAGLMREKETSKIIYPERTKTGTVYHLAWRFLLQNPQDIVTDTYFIVDAVDGKIIKSFTATFPDYEVKGNVRGEIYPINPTAPAVSTMPMRHEYVKVRSNKGVTNTNGDYKVSIGWWDNFLIMFGSVNARFSLEGPFAHVQNNGGAEYQEDERCPSNKICNHTWTAADRDHINVFYHMNLFHDWLKAQLNYNWNNIWNPGAQFIARVNRPNYANAHAGSPMEFGNDPYARSSDVIYHECTHNVLADLYGDYIGWPDAQTEGYAMDEGYADFFSCSFTNDSSHGEGASANPRNLQNNDTYVGKATYNVEGHTGGRIIAGAAWDIRARLITEMGEAAGRLHADNLVFDAHQILSAKPRDYFFSDPQESNLLASLYDAADEAVTPAAIPPHFAHIHQAFANHDMLQATLREDDSFDFSRNTLGYLSGGDLYFSGGSFWANNVDQRGVIDVGNRGTTPLQNVVPPATGYSRQGVPAVVGHTYVSLASQQELGNTIVFEVLSLGHNNTEVVIRYYYLMRRLRLVETVRIDFSTLIRGATPLADIYYQKGKFFGDQRGQGGVIDLGVVERDWPSRPRIPTSGYVKDGVDAELNHVYLTPDNETRGKHHIIFKVVEKSQLVTEPYVVVDFALVN